MKCPKCGIEISVDDFTLSSIGEIEIQVEYDCSDCDYYSCYGFPISDFLEE